jgi:hypothetical protein
MQRRCFYVGCRLLCVVGAACGKCKNYLLAYIFLEKENILCTVMNACVNALLDC